MKKILLFLLLTVFSVILVAQTETIRKNLIYNGSVNFAGAVKIGGVTVTTSGAELNFVDGVTSAIQTQLDAKVKLLPDSVQHTTNFTLAASDVGKDIYCTENGPQVITIPLNFSDMTIGSTLNFYAVGTGPIIFRGAAGVHLFSELDSLASSAAGQVFGLKKRGANNYWPYGPLTD